MSVTESTAQSTRPRPAADGLIKRQLWGILRMELRKTLFSRRAMGLYFLAFGPVALISLWAMWGLMRGKPPFGAMQEAALMFSTIFVLYLRVSIFMSALLLFMSLFRADILEKSLHYYFLSPVRREILVAGKYLAALIAAWIVFAVGTASLYLLTFVPWGLSEMTRYVFQGPGFGHLMAYIGTAILGVAGYGAVFLFAGQYFKNPVVPAVMIWLWEFINFLLPAALKKISVIFYLQSFYPVPTPDARLFSVYAEPPAAWASILGLLLFTAVVLFAASWRARIMEVNYSGD
jgi:ABC-type transport system involved in multi-copper enzyme maturation permease subunit